MFFPHPAVSGGLCSAEVISKWESRYFVRIVHTFLGEGELISCIPSELSSFPFGRNWTCQGSLPGLSVSLNMFSLIGVPWGEGAHQM